MKINKNDEKLETLRVKKDMPVRIKEWSIVIVLGFIWLIMSFVSPYFMTVNNITNILLQSANLMMVSIGLTFILICGMMDLSVGSVEALTGSIIALVIVNFEGPIFIGILAGIIVGALCGLINGVMIAKFAFPPFIATLAMQGIARGLGLIITDGKAILVKEEAFKYIGRGKIFGFLPTPVIIFAVFLFIAWIILKHSRFGVNVYAVGSNEQAAHLSGINVAKIKISVAIISGVCAAIGGLIMAARLGSGQSTIGEFDVMDGVASVVIGGTSMRGGVGSIRGTMVGVIIIATIRNSLNLLAVNSYWQQVAIGLIIVIAILIDQFSKGELKMKK